MTNAFPELSPHLPKLPTLPIFLIPEGIDLLTGQTVDPNQSIWDGVGDQIFFAQGDSRIATGLGHDLVVLTGYDYNGECNYLIDFDPSQDTLMVAANSFPDVGNPTPGKISPATLELFRYNNGEQALQYLNPPLEPEGDGWVTIAQFNDGTNRPDFTFDPSTILIG